MDLIGRVKCLVIAIGLAAFVPLAAQAQGTAVAQDTLATWYRLTMELVRHTPTYTPPVASRAFAYIGVAAYEAVASGRPDMQTLAGQLTGLTPLPKRDAGQTYDEAAVVQAALARTVAGLFANTGPTGQRALLSIHAKQRAKVSKDLPTDVASRSETYGEAVADHILAWAQTDGGSAVENMGFPTQYSLTAGAAHWVPTNSIGLQQYPLLPAWGTNRTFAMKTVADCDLPPPPPYSEDPTSEFYTEAKEVFDTKLTMTAAERDIARFWADDAMLSTTPPGHWVSIALQIAARDKQPIDQTVDILARVGTAAADAFIGAWAYKYKYDVVRPVTYIRRTMDPKWESLLTTPPFPEYPSGHSVLSGAAAQVLTDILGANFAFDDATPVADGLPARHFASFLAAADEAGISRMYGGIHYRAAIVNGLEQGRCIGGFSAALTTRSK